MTRALAAAAVLSLFSLQARAEPAPEFIRENAIRLEAGSDLPDPLYAQLKGYRVIAVGETHGTNETPAFVLGLLKLLAKNGRPAFLGLEIGADEQATVDSYLKTGKIEVLKNSAFFKREFQDGRSSRAMGSLLSGVRALRGTKVVCFDISPADDWKARDAKMASNLSAAFSKQRKAVAVLLAGNRHTEIVKDGDRRPMVYELHAGAGAIFTKDDILAIRQRFQSGSAWVCPSGGGQCAARDPGWRDESGYSTAVSWPGYFLKEPEISEGHGATVFSRTSSASAPLNP